MKLQIASNLALPIDFVTQTQAILAKKRVGKSYTAAVQAEELLEAGQQIVAVDPTGAWWGLKSSADGRHPGFPIAIFGGEHADVPLEETAGEVIARAIVEQRFSAILDLSLFRKGQINRFMAPFLETLYRLNREAMHLFVDEADAIAPQKPFGEEARMLGAMEDVVRRGGIRGIGCTMITQRPAVLNKNVLTQAEILTVLRIVHHKDIAAIREWIQVHGDEQHERELIASLPSLPIGTAWIWSPGWGDLYQQIKIRQRITFDSGATPKAGEVRSSPKVVAEVDLMKLGEQIQATVQRQKENDPSALKARIRQLEQELQKKQASGPAKEVKVADPAAIQRALRDRDKEWAKEVGEFVGSVKAKLCSISQSTAEAIKAFERELRFVPPAAGNQEIAAISVRVDASVPRGKVRPASPRPADKHLTNGHAPGEKLPPGERAVLIAAAQYSDGVERDQLSVLTGYKRSSRDAYIQRLREKGYVELSGSTIVPTESGLAALGSDFEPLPSGKALQDYWRGKLPEGERKVLELLISANGNAIPRDVINEKTGYKRSSRDAYLQRLAARRLVEYAGRGEVKASATLFD